MRVPRHGPARRRSCRRCRRARCRRTFRRRRRSGRCRPGPFAHSIVAVAAQGWWTCRSYPACRAVQVPLEAADAARAAARPRRPQAWSAQTGAPVPHWMVPVRAQGWWGCRLHPAVQEVQTCADEQYRFGRAGRTGARREQVWSVQTGVPVPQAMVADEVQGLRGGAERALRAGGAERLRCTPGSTPQEVPFETGARGLHADRVARCRRRWSPVRQGFGGVQASPGVQGRHWPAAVQTSPAPQEVPAATKPVSAADRRPRGAGDGRRRGARVRGRAGGAVRAGVADARGGADEPRPAGRARRAGWCGRCRPPRRSSTRRWRSPCRRWPRCRARPGCRRCRRRRSRRGSSRRWRRR